MLELLTLVPFLSQASGYSAQSTPAWKHPEEIILTHRIPSVEISLPIQWWDVERFRAASAPRKSPDGKQEQEAEPEGENVLVLDPLRAGEILERLPALETSQRRKLPADGRLVLVWDRGSTAVQVQMGCQFHPDWSAQAAEYEFARLEEPRTLGAIESGKVIEVVRNREIGDFPRWTKWFVVSRPTEAFPLTDPTPATLGILTIRLWESAETQAREWKAIFRSREEKPLAVTYLCVASSRDHELTWFWFEEEIQADSKGLSENKRCVSASYRRSWQGAPTTRIRWIRGGGATQPGAARADETLRLFSDRP